MKRYVVTMAGLEDLDVEKSMKGTVAALLEALARVEKDPNVHRPLFAVIESKVAEAEKYYWRPVDEPAIYETLARVYEALGDMEKALATRRKARVKEAEAVEFQARQLDFFGDAKRALSLYEKALSLDPVNELARKGVVKARRTVERAERALPRLESKIEKAVEDWTRFALAFLALDRLEEAEKTVDRALAIDNENIDVLCTKGGVLAAKGAWKAAVPFFERALDIKASSRKAKQGLNYAKFNLGTLD